jgi:TPR repeat protein
LARGEGVAADGELAAHYYRLSADQGNALGQSNYGWCLENGEGVAVDTGLAAHYYRLSADQGNESGIFHCARLPAKSSSALSAHYFKLWADVGNSGDASPEARAMRALWLIPGDAFLLVINRTEVETGLPAAAAVSPAVALKVSVDAIASRHSRSRIGAAGILPPALRPRRRESYVERTPARFALRAALEC